ncbi:YraN family protein [Vibrio sinensis]|uniref:Penicillin-binding protein activator LpoA n=1 Tax=Vibrio sinensis TaxID=2302434 RepID=A0A3A6QZI8_9VIBR|nr:penicillin-binding protein activator [Vibrio sinensis]RJX74414.1 YraN family protein [Vibrio sinensis]
MAMKNQKRLSVTRLLTPVALAVTLAACSTTPSAPNSVDITTAPTQSAQSYLMQADSSTGSLQSDWLIMAFKAAVIAGDEQQAELLTQRIARQTLSDSQQAEWQLTRAELLKKQNQTAQIVEMLNFRPSWQLSNEQWKQYHQLRVDSYLASNDEFNAAYELTELSKYAPSAEQASISQAIWANLQLTPLNQLTEFTLSQNDAVFSGWVQLAVYQKTFAGNLNQLKSVLEQWLLEHPNHPAALYTPQSITDILALNIVKPQNTALLLPLTGKFSQQAKLIRDGFILQMMNDPQRDENATLTVLDTNTTTIEVLKQTFAEKNIDFVVGPLMKENVATLQSVLNESGSTLPMLALNIPEDLQYGNNTCYLSLSPDQEVAQAAKHLFKEGYRYPLILAPKGRLGSRVVQAFEDEWTKYSNNKVSVDLFGDKRQLQRSINKAFGLQDSQQHIAQMESLLNIPLESQPRSRRDVDAVYIVASSGELTLIKPFIEVAINPDTTPPKLFSNSRSNNGRQQFEDLTGVIYSDIPLLIDPEASLESQMNQAWPKGNNAEKRLQALGMDAYLLIEQLPQMKLVPDYQLNGNTGVLSIDNHCVVHREMSWAAHGDDK